MSEMWVAIPGFDASYEVSSFGRVRRISRGQHTRPGYILKPRIRRNYLSVTLSAGRQGTGKAFSIHRLVSEAFIGAIPDGMQINHKNGNKTDNRPDNLEIVTPSENSLHSCRVLGKKGTPPRLMGEKNHKAKLREPDIAKIFLLRERGLSQQKIANQFGVDQTTVSCILRKKNWKHLDS